jgi:hypothetical protein
LKEAAMPDLRVSFPRPCDEDWEEMTPADRARVCARCDKAVHDLSNFSFDEANALVRADSEVCVRARVQPDGSVALKPSRRGDARRMVIAVAASAGLLAASAPAMAKKEGPPGAIAGRVEYPWHQTRVVATSASGQTFRAKVKRNGRFRIGHLPDDTYTLEFRPDCGDSWKVENIVVGGGETVVPNTRSEAGCIIVGMLKIEDPRG